MRDELKLLAVILFVGVAVWAGVPQVMPPPAVVRICGENNNGMWVRRQDVAATIASLEQQGCFRRDIQFFKLDHEWVFIWGTRLILGEQHAKH